MKCPIDGEILQIADRSGVEIDYCPRCRGVWLDRGELEKIIERSADADYPGGRHRDYRDTRPRKKRKESLLSELFDF